uniref:Tegument protein n=1 Tax=Bovine herpesvirus 4 TaxID=10385 RepID=A0A0F6N4X7_BHV4|nr:tegument protein [Bovine gammaherpesvirus 4]QJC19154.1 tegument protein [Bovine gammaherpesvirus 4]
MSSLYLNCFDLLVFISPPLQKSRMGPLKKIIQEINASTTSLAKIKILLDMELKMIPLEELSDPTTVHEFLNSLSSVPGDYIQFIITYPAFYLLRQASIEQTMPISGDTIMSSIFLLKKVQNILSKINYPSPYPQGTDTTLTNKEILNFIGEYIIRASSATPQQLPPTPTATISCFRCVEELVHAQYCQYWLSNLPSRIPNAQPLGDSILQTWLVAIHYHNLGIPPPNDTLANIDKLASKLVKHHHELFVPFSKSTETFITMPISKKRALEIYSIFSHQTPTADMTPMLAFTAREIKGFIGDYFFLYDYIIEALCKNEVYDCPDDIIEEFIEKGISSMTNLASYIEIQCAHKTQLTIEKIKEIRTTLFAYGLTPQGCTVWRTLLSTQPISNPPWKNFPTLIGMANQLTLFCHYFYNCLSQYSPTSLSLRIITDILDMAMMEQSSEIITSNYYQFPFSWNLIHVLSFFIPPTPEDTITNTYNAISSYMMKSMFLIWAKRAWNYSENVKIQEMSLKKVTPPASEPSQEEVTKYCIDIQVGDLDYNHQIIKSPFFTEEFIKHKVYPLIKDILGDTLQKNRAMFQLRWLILYAADETPGLFFLKKSLSLAYFQLLELSQDTQPYGGFHKLLNYLYDTYNIIQDFIPDATFPTGFIEKIYYNQTSKNTQALLTSAKTFTTELLNILQKLHALINLGALLCHGGYMFDCQTQHLIIPVTGEKEPLYVSIKTFKQTIQNIERMTREICGVVNQYNTSLNSNYLNLLTAMNHIQKILTHAIHIKIDDLSQVSKFYLECFKRYGTFYNKVTASCSYSLTKYFSFLFQEELIPVKIVRKVLDFRDDQDNPSMFLESLTQPLNKLNNHPHEPQPLTMDHINQLIDIYDKFPKPGDQDTLKDSHSIKHYYTDSFDMHEIQIDWDVYGRLEQVGSDTDLHYIVLSSKHLTDSL